MSKLVLHAPAGYHYLPGGSAYCRGVIAVAGFEIVHATFHKPLPYVQGFEAAIAHLQSQRRPVQALCAIQLRSPKPFTFDGFANFNKGYVALLDKLGIAIDGKSPMTRTNVAPEAAPPSEPVLYAFGYTVPSVRSTASWVASGAGDLDGSKIVCEGDTSKDGMRSKAKFVDEALKGIVNDLGVSWDSATHVGIYTVHPIQAKLLARSGGEGVHGARWYYSRPPIEGLEYEADVRSVWREEWL